MMTSSRRWRWQIWIACFAILLNALAPSISHALAAPTPAGADICSNGKLKPGTPSTLAPMADCAFCLPHAGSELLAPPTAPAVLALEGHALRPYLFYHAPRPLLALSAAPPRGPPALV